MTEEFLVQRDAPQKLAKWINESWKLLFHTWHVPGVEWCLYLTAGKAQEERTPLYWKADSICAEKTAARFLSGWNGHNWASVPCILSCMWSWCLLDLLLQRLCLCLNAFSAQRSMGRPISRHWAQSSRELMSPGIMRNGRWWLTTSASLPLGVTIFNHVKNGSLIPEVRGGFELPLPEWSAHKYMFCFTDFHLFPVFLPHCLAQPLPQSSWFPVLCLVTKSCPTLCDPMDCSLPGSSVHGDSSGKNTGVGCHAFLQGIFPSQGSNPGLQHWLQADSSPAELPGKPSFLSRGPLPRETKWTECSLACNRDSPSPSCVFQGLCVSSRSIPHAI